MDLWNKPKPRNKISAMLGNLDTGGLALAGLATLPGALYALSVNPYLWDKSTEDEDEYSPSHKSMRESATQKGVLLNDKARHPSHSFYAPKDSWNELVSSPSGKRRVEKKYKIDASPIPAAYRGMLHYTPKGREGILAHELGHVEQDEEEKLNRLNQRLYGLGTTFSLAGSATAGLSRSDKTALAGALLGTLGTLPMLGFEIGAARRGSKLMGEHNSNKSKLWSYVGLPAYAAVAAAPLLTYGLKKMQGGYTA